jgi:hypothetical protein
MAEELARSEKARWPRADDQHPCRRRITAMNKLRQRHRFPPTQFRREYTFFADARHSRIVPDPLML